jgi:glycerol-3-phosphate responsive antiterminator
MTALERIKLITSLVARVSSLEKTAPEAYEAFVSAVKDTISDTIAARADGDLTAAELLSIVEDVGTALAAGAKLSKAALPAK